MTHSTSDCLVRSARRTAAHALVVLAGALAPVASAQPFPIQLVAETSGQYMIGGNTYGYGWLGLPSLSQASGSSRWNLAVRMSPHASLFVERVLFFTNSSSAPQAHYPVNAGEAALPSAQFNSAAYSDTNYGVYSGNNLLTSPSTFWFGRPSAQGPFVAAVEFPVPGGAAGIVMHGPSGPSVLVDALAKGFNNVGLGAAASTDSPISFGRGGLTNVVFRGHSSIHASHNGIFAQRYDGTPPIRTIADNTMDNPLTSPIDTFNFSESNYEHLPVAHGSGAAWSTRDGKRAVLAKSDINGAIEIMSPVPPKPGDPPPPPGTYGNVSSAGASMLAYEFTPDNPNADKVIKYSLVGTENDAVRKEWITQQSVFSRGLSMGSEALVPNHFPLSAPQHGGFSLGFHADQKSHLAASAVYVTTIPETALDLGGLFGGDVLQGGDSVRVTARNDFGQTLRLKQEYGSGLGVNSSTPGDDPASINSNDGRSENLTFSADYDMTIDAVTFKRLDPGESVRFLLNGTLVQETVFEGNEVSIMSGLQYIGLDSLLVPAGSFFSVEHGGGVDDGFAVSSMIFGVAPLPSGELLVDGCFPTGTVLHAYPRSPGNPWLPGEWNAENATITGPVSGITPFSGDAMLRVNLAGGGASQVSQIIDVSAWASQIDAGRVTVGSSVQVNAAVATAAPQMFVLAGDSQTVVGTLNPVGGPIIEGFNRALAAATVDADPASWERMSASLVLPSGTRFLHFELLGRNATIPPTGVFFDCATIELEMVPPCPADFNADGSVDFFDYLDFASAFDTEDPTADFNRDGSVDFFDYLDFVAAFDLGCE